MSSSTALRELAAELGPIAVRTDPDELSGHVTPWRGTRGDAIAVIRPASTDEVRTVVAWARRHRIRLIPQGANTGLVGASTPPAGSDAAVLSLLRLDAGPVIDPVDRTAVVGAGVRLSTLNDAAAEHGLGLQIDLGADPTIGGMTATNTGGARMLRHGDMRGAVLGLRAVLADEHCSVVDELTSLRKHNVGPSVGQLLIGSGGAFGVITEVAVELKRLPPDRACAWLVPAAGRNAIDVLVHLEQQDSGDLSAFEVVSAAALDAACALPSVATRPFGSMPTPPHAVLVEFEGPADAADRLVDALDGLSARGLIDDAVVLPPDAAWSVRHSVTEGLSRRGVVQGFDVSVARPRLPDLVDAVRAALADAVPDAVLADFGHWGDGGVHCNVVHPRDEGGAVSERAWSAAREVVLPLVVDRFGGSFSAEHGVGPLNSDWWRRTTSEGAKAVLSELSRRADPLGLLGHPDLPYREPWTSSSARSSGASGGANR